MLMQSKQIWWPYIRTQKRAMAMVLVTGLVMGYCTLLLPLSIGKYLEILQGAPTGKSQALELLGIRFAGTPGKFFIFFFVLLLTRFFVSWLYHYLAGAAGEHFAQTLRNRLLETATQSPGGNTPQQISALAGDATSLKSLLTKGILGFVHNCLLLLAAFCVLYQVQPLVTLLASVCFLLFCAVNYWLNHLFKPLTSEKRKRQAAWLRTATGIAQNKHTHSLPEELTRLNRKNKALFISLRRHLARKSALRALPSFQMYLMLGCIMLAMLAQQTQSSGSRNGALSCFLLLITLFPVMRSLLRTSQVWATGALAARKFSGKAGHAVKKDKQSKKNDSTEVTFEEHRQPIVQHYGTDKPTGITGSAWQP